MTTYARQAEAMKTTREQALEGFLTFLRVNEGKAKDYPKYVDERLESERTLQQLATMEQAFGTAWVRDLLSRGEAKANEKLKEQGAA